VGSNGDIGSNTTQNDTISLDSNVVINGDATVGPLGEPSQIIDLKGNATITGSQQAAASTTTFDPATVPVGLSSRGDLDLEGKDTLTLPAGTYLYDRMSLKGKSQLILLGPVTLYVTDNVSVDSNVTVNGTKIPANFDLKVVGNQNVHLDSNVIFYGTIYAPESANVRMDSNSQLFGAIIAGEFEANSNSRIHYDEALNSSKGGGTNTVAIVSWQEA